MADAANGALSEARRAFDTCLPPELRQGLHSLERIVREEGIVGVHGPIVDLIKPSSRHFKAIEVCLRS